LAKHGRDVELLLGAGNEEQVNNRVELAAGDDSGTLVADRGAGDGLEVFRLDGTDTSRLGRAERVGRDEGGDTGKCLFG